MRNQELIGRFIDPGWEILTHDRAYSIHSFLFYTYGIHGENVFAVGEALQLEHMG